MTINLAVAARAVARTRGTHPVAFNAMSHCLESVATMAVGSGELGIYAQH